MLKTNEPLEPKEPGGPLRVIIIGRISTEHQSLENIDASHEYVKKHLNEIYGGEMLLKCLGERGSGMLKNRTTIREAEDLIETGTWDLVIVEDLARAYRNTQYQIGFVQHCVDNDTRLISIGDALDTADPNWQAILHVAAVRHGMYIPDTQRRVRRTASHSFNNGGMVLKVPFGYRKLSREEAATGTYGPVGLRIAKIPEATPVIQEIRQRLLRGDSYSAIARWLNEEGVPVGKYVQRKTWLNKNIVDLLRRSLLKGVRQFGRTKSKLVFKTGKHKRSLNEMPEEKFYPELAHMTPAELDEVWAEMDARDHRKDHSCAHRRKGVPRRESFWPGQHLKCFNCGEELYWIKPDKLRCRHSVAGSDHACWVQTFVSAEMVRLKLLPQLVAYLRCHPDLLKLVIDTAWEEYRRTSEHGQRKLHDLEHQVADLDAQSKRITAAIAKRPDSESLLNQLDVIDQELKRARQGLEQERQQLHATRIALSRDEVEQRLDETILDLSRHSMQFGKLLSRTFPKLILTPVQALDSAQIHPRIHWELPSYSGSEPVILVADAFEESLPIKHVFDFQRCRNEHPDWTLRMIQQHLNLGIGTIKRACHYTKLMNELGTADKYRVVTERPTKASRWRKESIADSDSVDNESSDVA